MMTAMHRNKLFLILIATALVLGAAYAAYQYLPGVAGVQEKPPAATFPYLSETYGIAFEYPETYTLTQLDVAASGNPAPGFHQINITDTKMLEAAPANGEGPPAISVQIFRNTGGESLLSWIKSTQLSNFNLSLDKKTYNAQIGGADALAYTWDGLYPGNSFVFRHGNYLFMVSATYMTPEDPILADFTEMLKSIRLQ
jgi:hypothetical protein